MNDLTELKKELFEIQLLAKTKFQENVYQRLLVTTISLLIVISVLILTISFLVKRLFYETLIGDFLLNLGTDFIGSTIIFVTFSVILKSNESFDPNKNKFRLVLFWVAFLGIITFLGALLNNRFNFLSYYPSLDNTEIGSAINAPGLVGIIGQMRALGFISSHSEWYSGQGFVNSLLLNLSTQFIGALIIFVGVEQLFRQFESQQEVQKMIVKRIDQLNEKI